MLCPSSALIYWSPGYIARCWSELFPSSHTPTNPPIGGGIARRRNECGGVCFGAAEFVFIWSGQRVLCFFSAPIYWSPGYIARCWSE